MEEKIRKYFPPEKPIRPCAEFHCTWAGACFLSCNEYHVYLEKLERWKKWKETEIRWYKGKYKVKITMKSKMNYEVETLEEILIVENNKITITHRYFNIGQRFTTIPRLLWRHPRK